jgi:hypothetical protein
MSQEHKQALIEEIIAEGVKDNLFSHEEVLQLRHALSSLSLEELVSEYLPRWYGDLYKWKPVDVETWLYDPQFMGLQGEIWPVLAEDFKEMMSGRYREAVLCGAIGFGKSFLSGLALARMVYEVSCYKNPQLALGLATNSPIVMVNVSTKERQAKEVVFEYVAGFVRKSPYFRRHFPMEKDLTKELVFPNKVRVQPAASTQGSVIGQNIYGAVLDEANFLFKGTSVRGGGVNEDYNLAQVLHNAMIRRIRSRFGTRHPGLLITVSSVMYPDDFTELRRKQAEAAGEQIFYRRYSQWTPKPAYAGFEQNPDDYFWLSVGDAANRPRVILREDELGFDPVLDDLEDLQEKGITVLKVPNDFRLDFNRDLDMAVRDVAGYATQARHPFFRNIQPLLASFARSEKRGLSHPWSERRTSLLDSSGWVKERLDFGKRLRHHFAHVDLALSQDACGICVVRLDGVEQRLIERPVYNEFTNDVTIEHDSVYEPQLSTVLLLQVRALPGREIPLARVRGVLLDLVSWGFLLTGATYDTYQSAESIQALTAAGVEAGTLSVDRTMDAYHSLKEALDEERLDVYEDEVLLKEISELERDLERRKIDHPPSGSKDLSDSLAGAVQGAVLWVRENPGVMVRGSFEDEEGPLSASPVVMGGFQDDEDDDVSWLFR